MNRAHTLNFCIRAFAFVLSRLLLVRSAKGKASPLSHEERRWADLAQSSSMKAQEDIVALEKKVIAATKETSRN